MGGVQQRLPVTLAELDALGLEKVLSDEIRKLIKGGFQETGLVIAFLYTLSESKIGDLFERNLKRFILKRWKDMKPGELFNQEMAKGLKDITPDVWGIDFDDDIAF